MSFITTMINRHIQKSHRKNISLSMENVESGSISWKWDEVVRIYKKLVIIVITFSMLYQRIEDNETQEKE